MKDWLKVFGLSFFSDKNADDAPRYGFVSVVLSIVLSFVFFMFGFMSADVIPFSSHYGNASQYREFIHSALSKTELQVQIKDGKAQCDKIVNTYTSDDDKEKYAQSGYNLIIDTRASDALIEFSQVAVKGDDEISYEQYLSLSNREKESYTLKVRYTDKLLELTPERVEKFETYLDEITKEGTEEYNAEASTAYKELKAKDLTQENYNKEIYYLYVKYYYSDIEFMLMSAKAPVLCDYYYLNFILGDNKNYLYLLDDICVGSFKTERGIPAVFVGYYKGCAEGTLKVNSVDKFIKDVYYNSVKYSMSSYFTSAMQMAPGYILIPVFLGFVLFLLSRARKNTFGQKFSDCYKIINSFVWVSALITGLVTFILAYFVFARKLYLFMPFIFALILMLRTTVFYFKRNMKEQAEREEQLQTYNEIF